jgi:hypothetical protein
MKRILTKIECAGGCGKFQMTRKAGRLWLALEPKPVPDAMIRVYGFYAVTGVHGFKTRTATEEERRPSARARFVRDFAIAVRPPTRFSKQ